MIKPVELGDVGKWVKMYDMKPLQIGVTEGGVLVMRTASTSKLEIMNLSIPGADRCWETSFNIRVKLSPPGTKVTLEVR